MTRLAARRTLLIWLVTVLTVGIAVAAGGIIDGRASFGGHVPLSAFIPHATAFAFWLCIVACGLPTAVALWLRQRHSRFQSVLGGLATAVLTFALLYLRGGIESIPAIPSMLIIIAAEFPIAFALTPVMPHPRARPVGSARPRS
jgi:hypothetical protein